MIKAMSAEKVVSNLPPGELAKFRAWFEKFDAIKWDRQFEEDVRAGKLDALAHQALEDYNKGNCKKL